MQLYITRANQISCMDRRLAPMTESKRLQLSSFTLFHRERRRNVQELKKAHVRGIRNFCADLWRPLSHGHRPGDCVIRVYCASSLILSPSAWLNRITWPLIALETQPNKPFHSEDSFDGYINLFHINKLGVHWLTHHSLLRHFRRHTPVNRHRSIDDECNVSYRHTSTRLFYTSTGEGSHGW